MLTVQKLNTGNILEPLKGMNDFGESWWLLELIQATDMEMIWIHIKPDYLIDSNTLCTQVTLVINRTLKP